MWYFAQALPAQTLFVYDLAFSSEEEALLWNDQEDMFWNFDLITEEVVDTWDGDIVKWGPEDAK